MLFKRVGTHFMGRRSISIWHRCTIWLTLVSYVSLPLSLAFTPAVLAQASASPLTLSELANMQVVPYTLRQGETVLTLAEQYHITVNELKTLNQLRTFSHPFEQLSVGDDIDVPKNSPSQVPGTDRRDDNTHEVMNWLSGNAAGITGAMKTQSAGEYAENRARSAMVSGTQSTVQSWLNQFGTARVELGTRDNFNLSDSSFDFLLPVYDSGSVLFFTQSGWRYHDRRNTINLGTGVRLFSDSTMYGINAFYDNDLTGNNRRLGIGGELWRDYLQFSVNGYLRLSDWHSSRDAVDYDERPANGVDFRVRGWLPAYPQLGSELKYEQYFGDEVALINKDERQKNPKAVSLGLNWSPIPLMTLSTDYRNSSGKDEVQMQAQLTYALGVPWAEQISAAVVGSRRTLIGSRQALVERNNNIILEYRKQELIHLTLPETVSGRGGSQQMLNALLRSKYGVSTIDWTLPADFTAKGGRVTAQSGDLSVWQMQLPAWQPGEANIYTLSATAKDEKSNWSAPAYVQVTVEAPGISVDHSTVTTDLDPLPVMTSTRVTLTIRDEQNVLVPGLVPQIILPFTFVSSDISQVGKVTLSDVTESSPGVYIATLTAGAVPGVITLSPVVDGIHLSPMKLNIVAGSVSDQTSSLEASPAQIPADGRTVSLLTLTLRDEQGNILTNDDQMVTDGITFNTEGATGITLTAVKRTKPGVFEAGISGISPEPVTVQALIGGQKIAQKNIILTPTSDQENLGGAYLDAVVTEPQPVPADGATRPEVTMFVKGKDGNPLAGQKIAIALAGQTGTDTRHDVTTDANAHVTLQLPPQAVPGQNLYTLTLNGSQFDVTADYLPLTPIGIRIFRGAQEIQKNAVVVGDILTAVPDCQFASCTSPTHTQWEVETAPGSGQYVAIRNATGDTYVVTADIQKRRLRVTIR
jgi:adhesin/invasin